MKQEMDTLRKFYALARSIQKNSKGEVLLTALRKGFAAAENAQKGQSGGALQQKALIFTESRRTQEYLFQILEQTQFAGKVVLFNGSNTDPKSGQIYRQWAKAQRQNRPGHRFTYRRQARSHRRVFPR